MVYHFGKTGYMSLKVQDTEGTAETFTGSAAGEIALPITDQPDLKPTIEKEFKQYYKKSSAEFSDYTVKKLAAEGSIKVSAFPAGPLEALLYGCFGAVDSVQVGATTVYTNTFTMDDSLPIFTAAVGRDALNYQEFYDLRLGTLDITYSAGEDITLSSDAMGKGGAIDNAAFTPSTYTEDRAFVFDDLGVSLGGSANCDITDLSLKIDRGLTSVRTACATGSKGDNVIYPTTISVEGSIEMFFQDYSEYAYWLGGSSATEPTFDQNATTTGRALTITATGEAVGADYNDFIITIPRIVYDTSEIDMPFDDRMKIKFDFKALDVSGTVITAVVNSEFDAETILV